jgi:hypothetical protein
MAKSSPLSGRIGSRFGGRGTRKRTRIFAGFITLIAVTYFGSTFAASISLGSDTPIEFGQGSRAAVACDDTGVETAIVESWDNPSLFFKVDTITLTGINNTATDEETGIGCQGKTIKVRLMDASGPLVIGSSSSTLISFVLESEGVSSVAGATSEDITVSGSGVAGNIEITLPSTLDASTVTRVALETE